MQEEHFYMPEEQEFMVESFSRETIVLHIFIFCVKLFNVGMYSYCLLIGQQSGKAQECQ